MQALGILMGLAMVGSFFLEWEVAKTGSIVLKVNQFLGVQHNAFFSVRSLTLDFLPVVLALAVILFMILAKLKVGRIIGLLAALLCLAVAARDIRFLLRHKELTVGPGLWIFAAASLIAVIVGIVLLTPKKSPQPQAPPASTAP